MNHSFNTILAERYGIEGAILVEHLYWWIHKNDCEEVEEMVHEGRVWCRSTAKGFAKYIPYMNPQKIRRILISLENVGKISIGNFNVKATNQTLWYAFTDEFIGELKSLGYDFSKMKNGIFKNEKSYNSIINNPIKEDNIIEDKENKLSNDNSKSAYSDDFLEFWEAYGYCKDKGTTYKRWKNLSKKDKEAALKALPEYFADCQRCDRKKRYPAVYISKRTWEDDFSNPEQEEPTEETACAMDPNEWLNIVVWLQEKAYKIHSQIDSKMFCEMKAMAGDSKLLAEIIIEIGELAEYNSVDVMTEFRRILKERKQ